MIERHWKATARPDQVANYLHHLRNATFPTFSRISGFLRATVMSKPGTDGVDLLVVTEWESLAAIEVFAGKDVDRAVVPSVVQSMMVRYDTTVETYEVIATHPGAS